MRTISAASLAKLATRHGTEPLIIVEVDWAGSPVQYADKDIGSIPGRIQSISELDNVVDVLNNNTSQEIAVTLLDHDGTIKAILDSHDVHQRNVRLYQYFDGLDIDEKFLLFQGKLSSPIVWSEGARTVSFNVVSQLEDKEFGFSAEEGQFPFLPNDMVGKAWPVIFGKVVDVPALQVNKAVSGSTLCGVGIISGADLHNQVPLSASNCDFGLNLTVMTHQANFLEDCSIAFQEGAIDEGFGTDDATEKAAEYADRSVDLLAQATQLRETVETSLDNLNFQVACAAAKRAAAVDGLGTLGCNPVRILGGEDFPQNTPITLNINGALFTGKMVGDVFTITSRQHPQNDDLAEDKFNSIEESACATESPPVIFDFRMNVPPGTGDFVQPDINAPAMSMIWRYGKITCLTPTTPRPSATQVAQHFWAEAGARVVMGQDEPITYIVSITPGEVLAVKAYKQFNSERKLVNVPEDLYEVQTVTYGTITAVQVVLQKPLSTIVDQGWGDDLYVTFESEIGPNIVDILEYIIDNYTDLDYDETSFDYVREKLEPFPANFPVLDRRNTIDLIKDIAFQARCAVWISNGVFYLKYLPEEPASDDTITVSDIDHQSIEVELTPTEDLVTKMVVTWRLSWADEDPHKIILRHNVNKYGTKEEEFDFYIYNQPDIVLKAATFWLIRKSNTWKKMRFRTNINKLNLETFDTVTLDLPPYVASSAVKAVVEEASYDSGDHQIDFEVWVPVKAGTTEKYKFAWPAALTVSDTFPTPEEAGNAGGGGIGAGATGELPIGYTDGINSGGTVFVGGPNVVFRSQSDRGDRTPGDVGFEAQTIIPPNVFAEVDNTPNPRPDLTLNYVDPLPVPANPIDTGSGGGGVSEITFDTPITDNTDPENPVVTKLSDILLYDEETGIHGAKLAYLYEDP